MKDIEEAKVGSGTMVADKSAEKSAQISLKMIQLRMKQNKERAALAAQKKSLQKEETMTESFSASQIAALKAEYSKISGIDPASDTYKKLIAMLDRLDLKSLQSLAAADVKFVSKLAQNRVMRKSMKKEGVEIEEGSGPKEKQTSRYVDRTSAEYKEKVQAAKDRMVSDKKAEAGKALLSKLKKEEVQIDELSTNKLADYKKKAGAAASAADKAGDTKTGNKRFSGIMKATRKQFGNDAKQKTEELSPKQKTIDKNKNGKIDGFDLSHLRKKNEELSPKQKELDKNKNGKIDGTDLAHLRSKKKLPQGADFAAQRRKERLASSGRMDEAKSDYEVYHKDYSGAVQAAIKQAEKRGYEVDMDDWHDKVATGPKKPSSGKTNSFSVNLMKDGKPSKKKLQMQVYNMDDHKYELNMYIEEIEQGVSEGSISDLLNKDSASPKFNDHPAPSKTKHSGSIPTPYEKGRLDAHRKKPYNNIHKDKQDAEDYKTGYGHVKSKQGVSEGLDEMDNRTSSGDRREKRNNSPEEKAKQDKEQQKRLKDTSPEMRKKLRLPEPKEGVEEAAKWRSNPGAYDVDDEGNKTPRNPNSPKFGYDPLQRRADTANDAKTPRGKKAALKTSLKMAKGNKGVAEETLSELNKDTLYSYAKKSEKDQGDQFNKIGKGIRDKDPKSANKAGHKFSMRSIGQNRAEKRLAKEAASPAQQAAIAIAMKKDGKKPKMSEGIVDKIKSIKRGMQAKAKADDHFDKAGDPKNANASKDLKKAVRYHNLLNKEEVVLEARKKSFKDVKKKMKEEETPNKSTVKKGDMLTGKKEPIEINPEIKS